VFKRLYEDVLDRGMKICVSNIREDGTYELKTYEESGWIFKRKWYRRVYILEPGRNPIDLDIWGKRK